MGKAGLALPRRRLRDRQLGSKGGPVKISDHHGCVQPEVRPFRHRRRFRKCHRVHAHSGQRFGKLFQTAAQSWNDLHENELRSGRLPFRFHLLRESRPDRTKPATSTACSDTGAAGCPNGIRGPDLAKQTCCSGHNGSAHVQGLPVVIDILNEPTIIPPGLMEEGRHCGTTGSKGSESECCHHSRLRRLQRRWPGSISRSNQSIPGLLLRPALLPRSPVRAAQPHWDADQCHPGRMAQRQPRFRHAIAATPFVAEAAWAWTTPGQDSIPLVKSVNGAELELTEDGAAIEGWQESWLKEMSRSRD